VLWCGVAWRGMCVLCSVVVCVLQAHNETTHITVTTQPHILLRGLEHSVIPAWRLAMLACVRVTVGHCPVVR